MHQKIKIIAGSLFLSVTLLCLVRCESEAQAPKKVVCYFTNWARQRSGQRQFLPRNIKPNLCSHIVYAYAVLDPVTLTIRSNNPSTDIGDEFYKQVTDFRQKGVKVLIAIGGLADSVGNKYDRLLTDANAIRTFIESVVSFIREHNFDGLDIEYPRSWKNGVESDRAIQGFAKLIRGLSEAFKPNGWLLSATTSADPALVHAAYVVPQLNQHFDWISLMVYDYHGAFNAKTRPIEPIYSYDSLNVDSTVKYWNQQGVAPEKLVLGIPTFGISFMLKDPKNTTIGAPMTRAGEPGPFTKIPGTLAYYEICYHVQHNKWVMVHDAYNEESAYAFHGDQWVSFESMDNVREKGKYIKELNLGGAMVWTLDFDDFTGICGYGIYPLLTKLNAELRGIV